MAMDTNEALAVDRADLIGLLTLRFGEVPGAVKAAILETDNGDTLERLILVAANVPTWEAFLRELDAGSAAFKIVGEVYNPIQSQKKEA